MDLNFSIDLKKDIYEMLSYLLDNKKVITVNYEFEELNALILYENKNLQTKVKAVFKDSDNIVLVYDKNNAERKQLAYLFKNQYEFKLEEVSKEEKIIIFYTLIKFLDFMINTNLYLFSNSLEDRLSVLKEIHSQFKSIGIDLDFFDMDRIKKYCEYNKNMIIQNKLKFLEYNFEKEIKDKIIKYKFIMNSFIDNEPEEFYSPLPNNIINKLYDRYIAVSK